MFTTPGWPAATPGGQAGSCWQMSTGGGWMPLTGITRGPWMLPWAAAETVAWVARARAAVAAQVASRRSDLFKETLLFHALPGDRNGDQQLGVSLIGLISSRGFEAQLPRVAR